MPVLVALLLYLPTLAFDLTYDDHRHVTRPETIETRTLGDVWQGTFLRVRGQKGGLYRPVTSTTFWLEGKLRSPLWMRHATNVLLHALATGLVVVLAVTLGASAGAAALAGMLFAVHPIHVETVAGLVGRSELLAAMFLLLAVGYHDRVTDAGARSVIVSGALAFLAAGSKESAWVLPLLALCLDLGRRRSPWRDRAWIYAGYSLGIGAHLVLRRWAIGGWLDEPVQPSAQWTIPSWCCRVRVA